MLDFCRNAAYFFLTEIKKTMKLILGLLLFLSVGILQETHAQNTGFVNKYNRFQYHSYHWETFATPEFHLYFLKGYDNLANFISLQFPDVKAEQEKAISSNSKNIPSIIIYPSVDQFYESNIGKDENHFFRFPTITLKGNRIVLYFNGSHEALRLQLKTALIRLAWEEEFKNDLEGQLGTKKTGKQEWYKEGCIAYFAAGWPLEKETQLLWAFKKEGSNNLEALLQNEPELFGQAFCYFLSLKYRRDANKQVVFQLKGGKSLNQALRLVLKRPLNTLTQQCFIFYQKRFASQLLTSDSLKDSFKTRYPKEEILQLLPSPDKKSLVLLSQKDNKKTVYLFSKNLKKRKKISTYTLPPWLKGQPEDGYPLIKWSAQNEAFVLMPHHGLISITGFSSNGNFLITRKLYGVDGVTTMEVMPNHKFLLAAFRKGKSDIVIYDAKHMRYTPLTNDEADNMGLSYWNGKISNTIVYRSGYPQDSISKNSYAKKYGIYKKEYSEDWRNLEQSKETLLLSDSAYLTWHNPVFLADGKLNITGSENGLLTKEAFIMQDSSLLKVNPLYSTFQQPWLRDYLVLKKEQDSLSSIEINLKKEEKSFLTKILLPEINAERAKNKRDSIRKALAYDSKNAKPYILQLHSTFYTAGIDNNYYINRYQPFQSYLGSFKFPEVGAILQNGLSDLFENHHFNIGYRMPTGSEGSDFFIRYGNTKRKTDWHLLYFRKVESLQPNPALNWKDAHGRNYPIAAKVKTNYYELGFQFPITYTSSFEFLTAVRDDRTIFLATDRYGLNFKDLKQRWVIATLSFSIDKTQDLPVLFLKKGWDMKISLDGMAGLEQNSTLLYGLQMQFSKHQPIWKSINFTSSFKAGYSEGGKKILYNFGGVDNNLVPRIDTSVHLGQDAPYAFQTLVTALRGHEQNSLYGNAYGLINLDLYFPLFAEVISLKTSFSPLKNLQLGMFMDIATVNQPKVKYNIHADSKTAYGFSARTLLASYPIRLDVAWSTSIFSRKPIWYLSLNF